MAKTSLTPKQAVVFEFIQRYVNEHRRSPLIREVQAGCHIASYKSALDRLNAIERKGLIKRAPNKHRGIKIIRQPASLQVKSGELSLEAAGGTAFA